MRVRALDLVAEPELAAALQKFERQFWYPLGPGRRFRIDHGADYGLFYRALGPSACIVATRGGRVVGALGVARRRLRSPDGTITTTHYLGDAKIAPSARGGTTLWRLGLAALAWAQVERGTAYGIVMEGTSVTPERYTGKVGIPGFEPVARVAVLRIPTAGASGTTSRGVRGCTPEELASCWTVRARGCFAPEPGDARLRSRGEPVALLGQGGAACGLLEDTLLAKRLFAEDGTELASAHLSSFAAASPAAGARLVQAARERCGGRGLPALFMSVPEGEAAPLLAALAAPGVAASCAIVYAAGLPTDVPWRVHTSEI